MGSLMEAVVADLKVERRLEKSYGMGTIVIKGINIPKASNGVDVHDPLVDIWCAVRKKAESRWRIDVAAWFAYSDAGVACTLIASTAGTSGDEFLEKLRLFEKHFRDLAGLFELTLEEWIADEKCGYLAYVRCAAASTSEFAPEIGRALVARFLYCIGLKKADVRHDRILKKEVRRARKRQQTK